jgi:hypothetical protein
MPKYIFTIEVCVEADNQEDAFVLLHDFVHDEADWPTEVSRDKFIDEGGATLDGE